MFKSNRPTYAIILFFVASLWMCATFLPLLYSVIFPNGDIKGVVYALEERKAPTPEAATAVSDTVAAAGTLKKAVPIAFYSGITTTVRVGGSQTIRKKQASFVAWFQKRSAALVMIITVYQDDGGRKRYEIEEGEATSYVRGYAFPVLLFGISFFLLRKRKAAAIA